MLTFIDGHVSTFLDRGDELEELRLELEESIGSDEEPPTSTESAASMWLKTLYSLPTPLAAAIAVLPVVGLMAAVVLVVYLVLLRPRAIRHQNWEVLTLHEGPGLEAGEMRHLNIQDRDSARVNGNFEPEEISETQNDLNYPLITFPVLSETPGKEPDHVLGSSMKSAGPDESEV